MTAHGTVMFGLAFFLNTSFLFSSRLLLVPATLTCHLLEQSGDSEVVAEDHHMFYKCFSAAMWDRFEVTAPGDCISAIKPKMVFRPTVLPAISFILGANGWRTSTEAKFQQSRRRPSAHTEMFFFHIFNSVQAVSVVVRRRLSTWFGVFQLQRRAW